ncbi:uncharacterized protein DNG_06360 [Cephalotrichum gorgonifer]|uniref:Heterokaryon incompatibility domain-containing protein n=1 Tax=Cephalotrichum gorgonifer TaxID=2041049 RepID=A0AAE8SX75_9PEZI|nr:uncharacterized protein DNG_06360 [Cephalotrichum gorgonifer]
MRLINASNHQIESFIDQEHAPHYAILSHTWGEDEVTLQDHSSPGHGLSNRTGFRKIEFAARQALSDGLTHVWVDTCCIDKTSSAELTEAINSMYEWYRRSIVCYAYINDLLPENPVVDGEDASFTGESASSATNKSKALKPSVEFSRSRWFTRGWTLQELIAPKTVRFYDVAWTFRGTKASLASALSVITRIEEPVLRGQTDIASLPVARRMAWAAFRVTTRIEDMAYCLLGIFDVNMPMLYGEGKRAFIRLQEEIMRESNDTSIFAWQAKPDGQAFRGVLASSPLEFSEAGEADHGADSRFDGEFSITNKGIRIHGSLWDADGTPIFPLKCKVGGKPVAILLHQHGAGLYARASPSLLLKQTTQGAEWKNAGAPGSWIHQAPLYISKLVSPSLSDSLAAVHKHGIHLRTGFAFTSNVSLSGGTFDAPLGNNIARCTWVHPSDQWDKSRGLFLTGKGGDFTGVITFGGEPFNTILLIVGIDKKEPWASFLDMVEDSHLIPDKSTALWDLKNLKRAGLILQKLVHADVELSFETDVVDGVLENNEVEHVD